MTVFRGCSALVVAVLLGLAGTPAVHASDDASARNRQYYGGSAGVSVTGSFTFKLFVSTPKTTATVPTRAVFRAALREQGLRPVRVGPVRGFTKKYATFNARNARRNLSMRTQYTRVESDAHHVMPQKFEGRFERAGINIHKPKHLLWWYHPSHQRYAAKYNRKWEKWFADHPNPTKKQVLRKAKKMRAEYAKHYDKPGPASCRPNRCRDR